MNKKQYMGIRTQLVFEPSDWENSLIQTYDIFLLLAAWTWQYWCDTPILTYLSSVALAVVFFHAFLFLHECGHGTFAKYGWENTLMGHFFSFFCFTPYYSWRYMHLKHHQWSGNLSKDPSLRGIRNNKSPNKNRADFYDIFWKLHIPMFAAKQQWVIWTYPFTAEGRKDLTSRQLIQCVFSSLLLLGVYGAMAVYGSPFSVAILGVAVVFYLVLTELVNLPHHLGLIRSTSGRGTVFAWKHHQSTRSCYYPEWISRPLMMNFNFHTEHHMLPDLPWHELPRARPLVMKKLGNRYREIKGMEWNKVNRKRSAADVFLQPFKN